MTIRVVFAAIAALFVAACNPVANLEQADEQVGRFQAVYNDGNAEALYRLTGSAFREVTSPDQMKDLVTVVSNRLGRIETSERANFNVSVTNGITMTVVVMQTDFEQGEGVETFTFHGGGENMELVGWNVQSPRLSITVDDLTLPNEEGVEAATE